MLKNHKVIFQGIGESKYYNLLNDSERAMVTKALYTRQALVNGEHIIMGENGILGEEFY